MLVIHLKKIQLQTNEILPQKQKIKDIRETIFFSKGAGEKPRIPRTIMKFVGKVFLFYKQKEKEIIYGKKTII